jgi:hypothetical protein
VRLGLAAAALVIAVDAIALLAAPTGDDVQLAASVAVALLAPGAMLVALVGPRSPERGFAWLVPLSLAIVVAGTAAGTYSEAWGPRANIEIIAWSTAIGSTFTLAWLAIRGRVVAGTGHRGRGGRMSLFDRAGRKRRLAALERTLDEKEGGLDERQRVLDEAQRQQQQREQELERRLTEAAETEARALQAADALGRERSHLYAQAEALAQIEEDISAARTRLDEARETFARESDALEQVRVRLDEEHVELEAIRSELEERRRDLDRLAEAESRVTELRGALRAAEHEAERQRAVLVSSGALPSAAPVVELSAPAVAELPGAQEPTPVRGEAEASRVP